MVLEVLLTHICEQKAILHVKDLPSLQRLYRSEAVQITPGASANAAAGNAASTGRVAEAARELTTAAETDLRRLAKMVRCNLISRVIVTAGQHKMQGCHMFAPFQILPEMMSHVPSPVDGCVSLICLSIAM